MGARVTGLAELLADLEGLPEKAPAEFRKVVSKGALNIKADWRRRWTPIARAPHNAPHLARGVGYDLDQDRAGTHIEAEIGVHRANPQASLAHFPEFGDASSRTPPTPGGAPALRVEAPKFTKAVADLAERLLSG